MSERIKPVFILLIWKLLSSTKISLPPSPFSPNTVKHFLSEKRIENKIAFAYGWRRIKGSNQTSKKTNSELSKDVVLLSAVWLLCQLFLFCWSWSEIGVSNRSLRRFSFLLLLHCLPNYVNFQWMLAVLKENPFPCHLEGLIQPRSPVESWLPWHQ